MDTNPNLYSKSETQASLVCRREQNKLSSVLNDLDKIHRANFRVLATYRKRFILDRRRSLGDVYNFQTQGQHPGRRIRRKRRDSVPEVVDIFRRQEERRQSLKTLEMALSQDALLKMDQKYQEALSRNRSDIDEEDALLAPNIDIDGPDYEDSEKDGKKTMKSGDEEKGKGLKKKKVKGEGEEEEEKDSGKIKKKDDKRAKERAENKDHYEEGEKNHRKPTKKEKEREDKDPTDMKKREAEQRKKEERKTNKEHRDRNHESLKKTETDTDKNDPQKTKKPDSENDEKNHKKTKKTDNDKDHKHHEKTKKQQNRKDETDNEKAKKKYQEDKDRTQTQKPEPRNSSPQRPKTSKTRKTGVVSTIPQLKQPHIKKRDTRYEDRNSPYEDDPRYREDSNERRIVPYRSSGDKPRSPSPVETRQIPQRKRSHSDGNIFMNLLELEDTLRQTYELSKAAAQAAAEAAEAARRSDEDSEDDLRMSFQRQAWAQTRAEDFSDSQSLSDDPSENDTSDIEIEVPESPWARQRRRGESSFNYTAPDVSDARWQMHDRDVSTRLREAEHRRGSYPRSEEIRLSPSLQRRLAGGVVGGHHSPRHRHPHPHHHARHHNLNHSPSLPRHHPPDVTHSPSPPRRRADASNSPSRTHPRRGQADVSRHLSPQASRCRVTAMPVSERDSSPRRRKKEDKPKPIFQQGEMERQAVKRRPLRRSRSEAVDVSALVTVREREGGLGVNVPRAGRRGSDSIQGLSTARMGPSMPQSWNSLLFGLALSAEEKEDIARHKRRELVASLRKRQEEVDSDVSRRIRTFLQRYEEV